MGNSASSVSKVVAIEKKTENSGLAVADVPAVNNKSFDSSVHEPNAIKVSSNLHHETKVSADIIKKLLDEFPDLQDVLEFIESIAKSVNDHISTSKSKKTMNLETKRRMGEIMQFYFDYEQENVRRIIGDKLAECDICHALVEYIKILTSEGKDYPLSGTYKFQCYELVAGNCWNYSDVSSTFSTQLCKNGIVHLMLETLKFFQDDTSHSSSEFMTLAAMSILHNCADENMDYFYAEPDFVSVIAWYTKNTSQEDNKVLALLSGITLAQVVDEKHNDIILADDNIIKTILQLLDEALHASDHRAEGFSALELTSGLSRLANNGENSTVIVKHGILKHLCVMLTQGEDVEKATAAETLWVLAFSNENKNQIVADDKIMIALKALQSNQTQSQRLNQAVTGALWVLSQQFDPSKIADQKKKPKQKKTSSRSNKILPKKSNLFFSSQDFFEEENEMEELMNDDDLNESMESVNKGHIMISYQWDYQELMIKVKRRLEADGYKIWMDLDEMGGSTLQAMAEAVENASVILMSFCRKYKESRNCRTEAEYAFKCKIPVIPLKVENNYDPDGWLGIIIGAKMYYDFVNAIKFEPVYSNLTKEIGNRGKIQIQRTNVTVLDAPAPPLAIQVETPKPEQPSDVISQWTSSTVSIWSKQTGIKNLRTKHLDGEVLLFLRKMRLEAPEFFYRCATDELGLKNVRELMLFTKALTDLK